MGGKSKAEEKICRTEERFFFKKSKVKPDDWGKRKPTAEQSLKKYETKDKVKKDPKDGYEEKVPEGRAGEIAYWIRKRAALPEDQGWIPSIHMRTLLSVTPVPEGWMLCSGRYGQ